MNLFEICCGDLYLESAFVCEDLLLESAFACSQGRLFVSAATGGFVTSTTTVLGRLRLCSFAETIIT
ncbi:hypothetical protein Mapa_005218 [Marchantia paleacea]|nr:hypothetical protein Mapa_005218 [Marchantia paleacea]